MFTSRFAVATTPDGAKFNTAYHGNLVTVKDQAGKDRQSTTDAPGCLIEVGGAIGKYAYGFGDKFFNRRHIIGHNGGSPGIAANPDMFPELGYVAIILSNYDPPTVMPVIMKVRGLIPAPTVLE